MIDKRRLCDRVADIMARALHYQERGEPDWSTMDYAATKAEYETVQRAVVDRYLNDAKYSAQVQRVVAMVMDEVEKAERASHPEGACTSKNVATKGLADRGSTTYLNGVDHVAE